MATDTPSTIIPVNTPFFQVTGGQIYKLNPETTASQVAMADGNNVETRINTLERAIAGTTVMRIAQTIAERDGLTGVNPGDQVLVIDASDDESVDSGSAKYLFMTDGTWLKTGESESMDIIHAWENITGGPSSEPAQIDLAVARQHSHDNQDTLSRISELDGSLAYKGKAVCPNEVWVCRVDSLADIPANLANGGLVFVNEQAEAPEEGAEEGE